MGQVNVETVAIRKKKSTTPQPKIEARRVVINDQVQKLHTAAKASSSTYTPPKSKSDPRPKSEAQPKEQVSNKVLKSEPKSRPKSDARSEKKTSSQKSKSAVKKLKKHG